MRKTERALHETLLTRPLRLLGRAIRRVPGGREMDRQGRDGRVWDAETGLFLRKR